MNTLAPEELDVMREVLHDSACEVFATMFHTVVQLVPRPQRPWSDELLVAGSVDFVGEVNGLVSVQVTAVFATNLARRMLDQAGTEEVGVDLVNDVIGELSNMLAGAVKSRLCDAGAACVLTVPSIVRGQNLQTDLAGASVGRRLHFSCQDHPILIELLFKRPKEAVIAEAAASHAQ